MSSELLICRLCQTTIEEPWVPPCNHVFCKDCTTRHIEENRKCPVCEYKLPSDIDFNEVLRLHPISNLINRSKQINDVLNESREPCSVESQGCQNNADWYCEQCGFWLCNNCEENHSKFLKDHEVESGIKKSVKTLGSINYPEAFCPHHESNELELVCVSCGVLVCQTCMETVHRGHEFENIMFEKNKNFEDLLQERYNEVRLAHEYDRLNTFRKTTDNLKGEIISYVDDVVHSLQLSRDRYLQELNTSANGVRMRLESSISELKGKCFSEMVASIFYEELTTNPKDVYLIMAKDIIDMFYKKLSNPSEQQMIIKFPSFVPRDCFPTDIGKLVQPSAMFVDNVTDSDQSDGSITSTERYCSDVSPRPLSVTRSLRRHVIQSGFSSKSSGVSSATQNEKRTSTTLYTINVRGGGNVYINQDKENTYVNGRFLSRSQSQVSGRFHSPPQTRLRRPYDTIQLGDVKEKVDGNAADRTDGHDSIPGHPRRVINTNPTASSNKNVVDEEILYSKTLPKDKRNKPQQNKDSDRKLRPLPIVPPRNPNVDAGQHRRSCSDINQTRSIDKIPQSLSLSHNLLERSSTENSLTVPPYNDMDRKLKPLPTIPLDEPEVGAVSGSRLSSVPSETIDAGNPPSVENQKMDREVQQTNGLSTHLDSNMACIYEKVQIDICSDNDGDRSVSSNMASPETQEESALQKDNRRQSQTKEKIKEPKRKSWTFRKKKKTK